MAPPSRSAAGHFRDARKRRARKARRARRLAGTIVLLTGVLVTLLLSAFGSSSPDLRGTLSPNGSDGLICAGTKADAPSCGPPKALKFARASGLNLQLPIAQGRVTAIGYHGGGSDAIPLEPYGRQANEGVVTRVAHSLFGGGGGGPISYYHLGGGEGPSTGAVDVGAAAGTDVYSPVTGTVAGISDYVVNGTVHGARIEIQPVDEPSIVVVLTRLRPDPALTVGAMVERGTSKVGVVLDFSAVERQALARITGEGGNHVTVVAELAATLPLN